MICAHFDYATRVEEAAVTLGNSPTALFILNN